MQKIILYTILIVFSFLTKAVKKKKKELPTKRKKYTNKRRYEREKREANFF